MTPEQKREAVRLYEIGWSKAEVCERTGITMDELNELVRDRANLKPSPKTLLARKW